MVQTSKLLVAADANSIHKIKRKYSLLLCSLMPHYIYVLLGVRTPVQYALGVRVHTLMNVFTSQMTGVSDLC